METTLYYKEGSSDKIYRAAIEERDGGFVVDFAYGRRGSTLTAGTKTQSPVPREKAEAIYDKLVKAKKAKGYSEGEDTPAYTGGNGKATDIRPQLLNPVDDPEPYLADDAFYAQCKYDGRRLLIRKCNGEVTGINRRGLECGIPETIAKAAAALLGDFVIDGEAVGKFLRAFDILERGGKCLRRTSYRKRLVELESLLETAPPTWIRAVRTAKDEGSKRRGFDALVDEGAEGIVFKRASARYVPGRPASGGSQFKFKFYETASLVVNGINEKRSVSLMVREGRGFVPAGNVTIPPNHPLPEIGSVVEVRYLYAMPESGSLFQPVYLGVRDDICIVDCTRDRLKFRKELKEAA